MRLTKQTTFAVRALIYCAVNEPGLSRVKDIAKAYSISEMFLFKIIMPLAQNGLIETVRGRRGGIRLAKPADRIRLLDVVRLTEDSFALSECFEADGVKCPHVGVCEFHVAMERALEAFMKVLGEYTIAHLAANPGSMRSVLGLDEFADRPSLLSFPRRPRSQPVPVDDD